MQGAEGELVFQQLMLDNHISAIKTDGTFREFDWISGAVRFESKTRMLERNDGPPPLFWPAVLGFADARRRVADVMIDVGKVRRHNAEVVFWHSEDLQHVIWAPRDLIVRCPIERDRPDPRRPDQLSDVYHIPFDDIADAGGYDLWLGIDSLLTLGAVTLERAAARLVRCPRQNCVQMISTNRACPIHASA